MKIINKIEEVKTLIRKYEPLNGYVLAFTGGKDSVLLKRLLDLSNSKYKSVYFKTTGESDDFLEYIQKTCPEVIVITPYMNIESLIKKYCNLPFSYSPWCSGNCSVNYSTLFEFSNIIITGYKDADVKDYLDVHPTPQFGKMIYRDSGMPEEHYIFYPLIDWTDEEVIEAIKYLDIELYRSYAYGVKSYSCPFCHSASKKLSTFLYPDLAEKWKGYAKYCYDNNEEIRQKFASPEAYWQYYLDYDLLSVLRNKSGNESDKNE